MMKERFFKAALAFLLLTVAGCSSPSSESADVSPVSLAEAPAVEPTAIPTFEPIPVATIEPAETSAAESLEEAFPVQGGAPTKADSSESRPTFTPTDAAQASEPVSRAEPSAQSAAQSGQVWVNSKSGIYHHPGGRWYGTTKEGYFTTEAEAIKDGNRASLR